MFNLAGPRRSTTGDLRWRHRGISMRVAAAALGVQVHSRPCISPLNPYFSERRVLQEQLRRQRHVYPIMILNRN